MKIAMIGHKRVPGGEGGVEVVVEELSKRMASQGHEVTLYNRAAKGITPVKEYAGCRVITVPTINTKSLDAPVYAFFATIHAIFGGYDVIHFHALGPGLMIILAKLSGRHTVATVHGLDWQRAKWGGLGTKVLKLGEKIIARYADEVIVLSKGVQQYFRDVYGRDTHLIPNGVTLGEVERPKLIQEKYDLKGKDYILFLSRIVPEKGLHYLLQAYKALNPEIKLVVAGGDSHSGEYYLNIKKEAEQIHGVVLTGFVRGREKEELLANAALYVLPSDIEGMPISLLEAMSYGTPCLVSDIEENTQVLGQFGKVFKAGNEESLAVELHNMLVETPFAGDEQRKYIREHYSWEEVTRETLELYKK